MKKLTALLVCLAIFLCAFSGCKVETVKEHNAKTTAFTSSISENGTENFETTAENGENSVGSSKDTEESHWEKTEKATEEVRKEDETSNSWQPKTTQQAATTAEAPESKPADSATTTTQPPQSISVTVSVTCKDAVGNGALKDGIVLPQDGNIIKSSGIVVKNKENVFEATRQACEKSGVTFLFTSSIYGKYVNKIGQIAEKECGAKSGWTYTVNGEYPQGSCDAYQLKNGDKIQWIYKV